MTKEEILIALKQLKNGENIDLIKLPDLTPEEQKAFDGRNTIEALKRMLRERGINDEEN